jgi:hypothetical protein
MKFYVYDVTNSRDGNNWVWIAVCESSDDAQFVVYQQKKRFPAKVFTIWAEEDERDYREEPEWDNDGWEK